MSFSEVRGVKFVIYALQPTSRSRSLADLEVWKSTYIVRTKKSQHQYQISESDEARLENLSLHICTYGPLTSHLPQLTAVKTSFRYLPDPDPGQ